jgi:NAD(P)H-hydrate epimerase
MKIVTREEARELDRRAIEEYGIPGVVLMENAGRRCAEEALKMLKQPSEATGAVVCGKGNNGGDGFVIARHLHNAGVRVTTYLTARIADCIKGGDAATNLRIALKMGLAVQEVTTVDAVAAVGGELRASGLVVDALFGTGLSGEVAEPHRSLIVQMNAAARPILAVDIPSGLDCNTGVVLGVAVRATKTVTFIAPKAGFYKGDGPTHVGELVVADIGLPKELCAEQ